MTTPPVPVDFQLIADADEAIARAEQHVLSLKILRNSLSPIHRMPDEILIFIMDFVRRAHLFNVDGRRASDRWIYVTFVCSRWRRVALGYPPLWTSICSDCRPSWDMQALHLERSRTCPIDLIISCAITHRRLASHIFENRHRWRNVSTLRIDSGFLKQLRDAGVTTLALPLLESANVKLCVNTDTDLAVIENLHLPKLKILNIGYNQGDLGILQRWFKPTLVELKIIDNPYRPLRVPLAEWLDILRALPLLTSLTVLWMISLGQADEIPPTDPPVEQRIRLQFLRRLHLEFMVVDDLSACAILLRHLDTSWPLALHVELEDGSITEVSIDNAPLPHYRLLANTLARCTTRGVQAVTGPQQPARHIATSIVHDQGLFMLEVEDKTLDIPLLDVSLCLPKDNDNYPSAEDLVSYMCEASPALFSSVYLEIGFPVVSRAIWNTLATAHIMSLKIHHNSFDAFLDELEAKPATFMPRLEVLEVHRFRKPARVPPPRPGQKVGRVRRPVLQRLSDVLFERRNLGMGPSAASFHGKLAPIPVGQALQPLEADQTAFEGEEDYGLSMMLGLCCYENSLHV